MIIGIGIDVVDVARFAATLERTPLLAERLFTAVERERSVESLAGRFAAKEALAKALDTHGGLLWHDAEVHRLDRAPWFELRGTCAARAAELGITHVHLTMSHDGGIATAMVVAESREEDRFP